MDPGMGNASVRKMEDSDGADSKRDIKPQVKTLNRVPRTYYFPQTSFNTGCLTSIIKL